MKQPILVSACLLGLNTRYDGQSKPASHVAAYLQNHGLLAIPICPEQLAGLATPRPPCNFTAGDGQAVLDGNGILTNDSGENLTDRFVAGAKQALEIARITGCSHALLKERSPSCGVHAVYCGTTLIEGQGVTSALFLRHGIDIFSEEDLDGKRER